jgi:peptidoglycan/LPS O-acetylase OafA/YrhL
LNKYVSSKFNIVVTSLWIIIVLYVGAHMIDYKNATLQLIKSQNTLVIAYGILAYWINVTYTKHSEVAKKLYLPAIILSCVFICFVDAAYSHIRVVSLGIPCLIAFLAATRMELAGILNVNATVKKAIISFADIGLSLYLTHIFIYLAINRIVVKYYPIFKTDTVFGAIVVLTASISFGYLVHHIFDMPVTNYLRSKLSIRKKQTVIV